MPAPVLTLPGDEAVSAPAFHWTAARKAEVVRRVTSGEIELREALHRFRLTLEEYDAWARALHRGGHPALKMQALPGHQGRLL